MGEKLTRSDVEKIKEEIEYRKLVVRKKELEAVKEARAQGDLSENNTVDVYFEDDDEVETYRLVTSVRGNSLQGLISIESPLGKALKGHKVGDRVFVKAGDSGYYVVIRKIENTTDDSHDTLRKY